MNDKTRSNVVPLFPGATDDESVHAGWDPYIFAMLTDTARPHGQDRRRAPRLNTPMGRRALLIAQGRRRD